MNSPPWIVKSKSLFAEPKRIDKESHKLYNSHKWRKLSSEFIKGKLCCIQGCLNIAEVTDHIIPISKGGSYLDRRNWQPLCHLHHNQKRARESRGIVEAFKGTKYGKIPERNAHLKPDIAGESYLTKSQTNGSD